MFSQLYQNLVGKIKDNKYDFLRFDLIRQDKIKAIVAALAPYDTIVIIGFGASSLNVRALVTILLSDDFAALHEGRGLVKSRRALSNNAGKFISEESMPTSCPKKVIYLDSLDKVEIDEKLSAINLSNTLFFSLSKSGNTNETYLLTKYILEIWQVLPQNLYIISPSNDNLLGNLAKSSATQFFEHDYMVSGRFSIISNASLLPAAVAGVDISKVINGACAKVSDVIMNGTNICRLAEYYIEQYFLGRHIFVMLNYSYQLDGLCRWRQQIIAESLGKNGFGITPVIARGTFDQHSQLQLYLEGPDDKFYEIITNNQKGTDMAVSLAAHASNIYQALTHQKRPVILNNFQINEETIIGQIIDTQLCTLLIAEHLAINPFNQPSVDKYKS